MWDCPPRKTLEHSRKAAKPRLGKWRKKRARRGQKEPKGLWAAWGRARKLQSQILKDQDPRAHSKPCFTSTVLGIGASRTELQEAGQESGSRGLGVGWSSPPLWSSLAF